MGKEKDFEIEALNPYESVGFVYLCGFCQKEVLPQKQELLVKNKSTQDKSSNSTLPSDRAGVSSSISGIPSFSTAVNSVSPPNTAVDQGSTTAADESTVRTEESITAIPEQQNRNAQTAINETVQQNQTRTDVAPAFRPRNVGATNSGRQICRFYKENNCRHGVSGKRDGTCPFEHPKACQKFITNGTHATRGCKKGTKCTSFHPKMCHSSLKEKTCYRQDCKFLHIKGTQRTSTSADQTQASHGHTNIVNSDGQREPPLTQTGSSNSQPPSVQSQYNPFLDQLKSMQDQMTALTSKLQQMDANYGNLLQQALYATNRPQPYPNPFPYFPQTGLQPQQYPRLAQPQSPQTA